MTLSFALTLATPSDVPTARAMTKRVIESLHGSPPVRSGPCDESMVVFAPANNDRALVLLNAFRAD